MHPIIIACAALAGLVLAGCESAPIVKDLTRPDPALMAPPVPLPPIDERRTADLSVVAVNNAEVRGVCVADQRRLRDLQIYVKSVVGE